MLFCRTEFLEDDGTRLDVLEQPDEGVLPDWLTKISSGQRLQCASVVMRRATYQMVGGFDPDLRFVPDWVMWVRVAAITQVAYVPEALATYRIHAEAETNKVKAAGLTAIDLGVALREFKPCSGRPGVPIVLKLRLLMQFGLPVLRPTRPKLRSTRRWRRVRSGHCSVTSARRCGPVKCWRTFVPICGCG